MSEAIVHHFIDLYKEDYWVEDAEGVETIDDGTWEQDGKYQSRSSIYKFQGIYIQVNEYRSGSYHSDWYYNDSDIFEVERVAKVITTYDYNVVGKMHSIPRD